MQHHSLQHVVAVAVVVVAVVDCCLCAQSVGDVSEMVQRLRATAAWDAYWSGEVVVIGRQSVRAYADHGGPGAGVESVRQKIVVL